MMRGYTVVEVVLVLAVLAIASAVTLPLARRAWLNGEAREVVEAIRAVEAAAAQAREAGGTTEGTGAPSGPVPASLAPYLPTDFAFDRAAFRIRWSRWMFGGELDPVVDGKGVGSVVVDIPDPALQEAFLRLAYPSLWFRVGNSFAFLLPEP